MILLDYLFDASVSEPEADYPLFPVPVPAALFEVRDDRNAFEAAFRPVRFVIDEGLRKSARNKQHIIILPGFPDDKGNLTEYLRKELPKETDDAISGRLLIPLMFGCLPQGFTANNEHHLYALPSPVIFKAILRPKATADKVVRF